jgi:hypothetical protein
MSMREMMGCIVLLLVIRTNNSEGNVRITALIPVTVRQRDWEACRPWGLVSSCFFHHLRVSVCSWHVLQWYGNDNVIHFDRPWTTPVWAHTAAGVQHERPNRRLRRTEEMNDADLLCLSMTFVGTSKLATKEMNDASFAWAWRLF